MMLGFSLEKLLFSYQCHPNVLDENFLAAANEDLLRRC